MNLIIGLDVDGVLRDWTGSVSRVYKKIYPHHEVKPITAWDIAQFFPIGEEIYKFAYVKQVKDICLNARPYKNAAKFAKILKDLGNTVIIISSQPNEKSKIYTRKWLKKNEIIYDKLFFSNNKHEINFDVHLDDSPKNIISMREAGKNVVCLARPWNRAVKKLKVKNYTQFIELLRKINGS
jgi:5'(3')-deoxyribonucleotidase